MFENASEAQFERAQDLLAEAMAKYVEEEQLVDDKGKISPLDLSIACWFFGYIAISKLLSLYSLEKRELMVETILQDCMSSANKLSGSVGEIDAL